MKAIRLKTEYLANPIGIDVRRARLMWNCEGGKKQTAYQIATENWDSGKVESASMHAEYPLSVRDRERVNWKIRLWDETGKPGAWSEGFFEAGVTIWAANWITGDYEVNKKERYPVDCFRKIFTVREGIKKARLYITAHGARALPSGHHHRAEREEAAGLRAESRGLCGVHRERACGTAHGMAFWRAAGRGR